MGRFFPSLLSNHAAASPLALRGSSALECPHQGSAEPSPRPQHSCTVQSKPGEARWRSADGFAPSPCWGHACKLYSSSLFIAGSWIHVPQAEAKLLCAVHCTAASPGEAKGGNKKKVLSSQYLQISYNGGFVGLKATAEGGVKLWMSSQRLKLNRRNVAQQGSLPASLRPAFFQP